MVVVVQINLI